MFRFRKGGMLEPRKAAGVPPVTMPFEFQKAILPIR